jgi:hypothetical protein
MNVRVTSPFDDKIREMTLNPRIGNSAFRVFPGLVNDSKFCELATRLVCKLHAIFPETDWSPCLTVPGYWPVPRGGIAMAKVWELPKSYKKALRLFGKLMYQRRRGGSTSIKKTSTTSLPKFTTSLEYKRAIVEFWMNYGDEILETYDRKGFEGLLQLPIAIVYGGKVGYRGQADSFNELSIKGSSIVSYEWKVRKVWQYMGIERVSDKTIHAPFAKHYPYMQAQRSRQIAQESQTVNLPNVFFYKQIQRGMFDFGGPVWKNHEGSENARKLEFENFPYLLKLDVKELDRHLHYGVLSLLRKGYEDGGCDPRWTAHLERCIHGPMLCLEDAPPYKDWSWTYDPRKIKELYLHYDYGMPSGYAGVAPEDKAAFTSLLFSTLVDIGMIRDDFDETDILLFLENKLDCVRVVNSGDDTVMAFKHENIKKLFLETIKKSGMTIEEEPRISFLGQDFVANGKILTAMPQLSNSLKNILVPEHEWGGRRRQVPGFGLRERNKYYQTNPAWETVWHVLNSTLRELGLQGLDDYIADGSNPENRPPIVGEMSNLNDVVFALNPDAINYKLNEEDVSMQLLDMYYLTYDEESSSRMNYLWEGR